MLKNAKQTKLALLALTMLVAVIAGCSENNPMSSSMNVSNPPEITRLTPGAEIELYGHVATLNVGAREMSIAGDPTQIVIDASAEVVFKDGGNETPIEVSDINVGDSVEVRGDVQSDGSLLANRVRVRTPDNNENELELKGRVSTIDPAARTITLIGNSTLINVLTSAVVVHKVSGTELPIELFQIMPNDSVEIRGNLAGDGSLSADRVRLRNNDDFIADVEIKDTITAIDYENGTIMIRGRSETVMVDALTYIFTRVDFDTASTRQLGKGGHGDDDDGNDDSNDDSRLKATLTLANLAVGDYIELHANIIDAATLYAVAIELEDGAFSLNNEVEFKDVLASVDLMSGEVTFQTDPRVGEIVEQTVLLGLQGESLTLDQFSVSQIVEVRGFDLGNGRFRVLEMKRDNTL